MMKTFEDIKEKLLKQPEKRKIGVVAAGERHTLEAVVGAAKDGLVMPVLIGDKEVILTILEELQYPADKTEIIDLKDPVMAAEKAAELAQQGKIDCIMKGKIETADLMRVMVNKEKGIRQSDTMSYLLFIDSPYYHKVFTITDAGLLTYPNYEQKRDAIVNGVKALHNLGVGKPKVAVLAAVERVNPKMKETVDAAELKQYFSNADLVCDVEGPISYDLSMDKEAVALKDFPGEVGGDADLLVVPDIAAGNILGKSLIHTGGARTCGVILGAKAPIVLTSRSATADDKYMSIVTSALV